MATDHNHLSLSMTGTLASGASSQHQPPRPPPPPQSHQQSTTSNSQGSNGPEDSPTPTKRGPGRPKGSTKKSFEVIATTSPKTKRPVGRPRKDGRPAGSVPKVIRGPGRPRKTFPSDFGANTFGQQTPPQQPNGDENQWDPLQGLFNNYRLPKDTATDSTVAGVVGDPSAEKGTAPPTTTVTDTSRLSQRSKWFTPATTTNASNAPAASSSSIANALMHPHTVGQSGVKQFSDPHVAASSVTGLVDRRENVSNTNNVSPGTQNLGESSSSVPHTQIPDFLLNTIYSLFSRSSRNGLALPREVLSTYRSHIGHLSGSHSLAYNILKTFWLPYSPLLFRLVLPRSSSSSKSVQRNFSTSQRGPASSLNSNFPSSASQPTVNGDSHSTHRSPVAAELNYDSHRFFYWDPFYLSLSGPLNCPVCQNASLTHLGPIHTGPLRVFDLPSSSTPSANAHANEGLVPAVFYVIGMQYGCSQQTCGNKFNSWDPRIINNLPPVLADEWPVHLLSVSESEQSDHRGARWSGDAVSRPLYTLAKALFQAGTSKSDVRDVLAQLWNWNDSDREDEHEGNECVEEVVEATPTSRDKDKVAAAEAVFASPYHRLWNAQTAQRREAESSVGASIVNGQRPAKRQKTSDVPQSMSSMVSAPASAYLSRAYAPQGSTTSDNGSNGVALQVPDHRANSSSVDTRSPRMQPQPQPQSQPHVRHQPSQSQLNANASSRPQPSPHTALAHARPPHIHTPSPIYPSTSLPNSTTNSPQTGSGGQLGLKRPLEAEVHHPNNAGGASVPSAPPPPPASTQTSPAQPHFPGIVHNSPYSHLRPLQPPQQPQHASHPSQGPPQPPTLATHVQPPVPPRPGAPLHMHHPSLSLGSNPLARYGQTALQPHQSLLSAPHAPPPHPPQPQVAPAPAPQPPQRRVRHCVKCGRQDCKGKGGSQFCKNNCKDCGSPVCRGRNSKRPNATCRDGW